MAKLMGELESSGTPLTRARVRARVRVRV